MRQLCDVAKRSERRAELRNRRRPLCGRASGASDVRITPYYPQTLRIIGFYYLYIMRTILLLVGRIFFSQFLKYRRFGV